jgi:hypothetical protein
MANLKKVQAALDRKQAELDMIDDQLMGMPEMAEPPMGGGLGMGTSPEFDMLADKREQLEEEIRKMREGIQLISEWEKLKNGQWSEEIKRLLSDIDPEIAGIAGGEPEGGMGIPPAPLAPPAPAAPPAPELAAPAAPAPAPEAAPVEEVPAPPAAEAAPEVAEPAPLEPPMASQSSASKKNSYQSPDKKGISASSETKKEGSTMATDVQKKLAEIKTKREAIKKEAQVRVASAWTIAKTMLPDAPANVQKSFAANLLLNQTKVLNAALRQTAKNAHYTKIAEQFKEVHKVELNDLLENPSILKSERAAVEKELKGEAKNATAAKTADDRKDAGPQTETYNDGRGHGGGPASEPKPMDAGSPQSQTEAEHRPMDTVNKSEGDKAGKEASAKPKTAHDKDCKGCDECKKSAAAKCAHGANCEGCDKCAAEKKAAAECKECKGDKKCSKHASVKTAEEPMMDAPPAEAPAAEAPMDAPPAEEVPMHDEMAPPSADATAEMITDEKTEIVMEEAAEIKDAISAIEQALLTENAEQPALPEAEGEAEIVMDEEMPAEEEDMSGELNLASVFDSGNMEEKKSALANEGESSGMDSYFGPTSAEQMEASLEGTQMASMEDFFSLQGADADPLASLIASEIKTAEQVAGMDVVESFSEAAKHFESDEAKNDTRDNESDHKDDLFDEALKEITPEEQGAVRTKQDATNELQAPKSAAKAPAAKPKAAVAKTASPVIKRLKPAAPDAKPVDIATALFGRDEF